MSVPDVAMPFLLLGAFRGLVDGVHADLAAAGLPGIQARHGLAMQAIGDGCTSVELARRLGVSKQAATKTAQALQELGLVGRAPHPDDGRALVIAPTDRGRRMLRLSAESFARQLGGWRRAVGDDAVDATLRTLAQADAGARGPLDLSHWQ